MNRRSWRRVLAGLPCQYEDDEEIGGSDAEQSVDPDRTVPHTIAVQARWRRIEHEFRDIS
jgi:hypothetical protein